ncbi:MAG: hypothetical protein RLN87_14815 [Parasphingopyxis sp.]|uniref:hypothetical protein n=1 Tax=Parasphingopyxis sp. TaxID=1920299 RepID=UPI0032EE94DA
MRFAHSIAVAASIGIAALAGAPAVAQQTASAENQASEGEVNASNEILCRRQPPPTGSRIGGRNICKTRAEWERLQREARNEIEDAQRTGLQSN